MKIDMNVHDPLQYAGNLVTEEINRESMFVQDKLKQAQVLALIDIAYSLRRISNK